MGRMIDGAWHDDWSPSDVEDEGGRFVRKPTTFRDALPPGPLSRGRFHLYAAKGCPWAHRTVITRALKGLVDTIPAHWCDGFGNRSWRFLDGPEPVLGAGHLYELYLHADAHYTGRVTVPVLWDQQAETIVNNESSEIIRMLDAVPSDAPPLAPPEWLDEIDAINARMYRGLNNGVYRAGFATSQDAYDEAVREVFDTLNHLEAHLAGRDWLVGDRLTEADIRLFVTTLRFDAAYHTLFKCNLRRIAEYPNLQAHLERVYAVPGIAPTCDLQKIRRGYASIRSINPHGIVPIGPPLLIG